MRIGSPLVEVAVMRQGGRIVSLRHVESGHEWLAPVRPDAPVDGAFADGPMGGWDEMLPTIDAGPHPVTGDALPDHGELWSVDWDEVGPGAMEVDAPCTGGRFRRTITVDGADVTLEYALSAERDLVFLWAAHPQFAARPGTWIELGEPADLVDVSEHVEGARRVASSVALDEIAPGTARKLYAHEPRSATLHDPSGRTLRVAWSAPYAGLWLDRGDVADGEVVAIEPTTGWFDSLERAHANGTSVAVAAGGVARWQLTLSLG